MGHRGGADPGRADFRLDRGQRGGNVEGGSPTSTGESGAEMQRPTRSRSEASVRCTYIKIGLLPEGRGEEDESLHVVEDGGGRGGCGGVPRLLGQGEARVRIPVPASTASRSLSERVTETAGVPAGSGSSPGRGRVSSRGLPRARTRPDLPEPASSVLPEDGDRPCERSAAPLPRGGGALAPRHPTVGGAWTSKVAWAGAAGGRDATRRAAPRSGAPRPPRPNGLTVSPTPPARLCRSPS